MMKEWILYTFIYSWCTGYHYKRRFFSKRLSSSKDIQQAAKQDQEELAALKEKVLVNTSGEEAATSEESPLMTASPTLPQSNDTHVEEDPTSSGSMGKSPENYPARDIRIRKLEDENTELHIRCQQAESNNTKLVLQLTRQSKYINEILNQDQRSQPSSITDVNLLSHLSDKYIGQECTSCLELQDEVTQLREALQRISISRADQIQAYGFELIIPKEEYEMVKDAMDKSKSAIFVKCDGSKKFVHAVADVDN